MKKAREINIPNDRPLTKDEFNDFKSHAFNSSLWYASEYVRSERQIIDKLLAKGYVEGEVAYTNSLGEVEYFDIIEAVLQELREGLVVNDETYARGLIRRYAGSRRGSRFISQKLREKGIDSDLSSRLLEEMIDEDDTLEAIASLAEKYMNTSAYTRVEDKYKRRQKLMSHLISRGYSFDDISSWESSQDFDD